MSRLHESLSSVKAVLFDAGHTLVFPDHRVYREIAEAAGARGIDDARILTAEIAARHEFEALMLSGRKPEAGWDNFYWNFFYGHLFRHAGVPEEKAAWCAGEFRRRNAEGLGCWNQPAPDAAETLVALGAAGYTLGVISNSDGRVERLLDRAELARHLSFVIDSEVVGFSKPDRRIFELGLERAGTRPGETIYVGDYVAIDVAGARAAGMIPVLYDPHNAYDHRGEGDGIVIHALRELIGLLPGRRDAMNGAAAPRRARGMPAP